MLYITTFHISLILQRDINIYIKKITELSVKYKKVKLVKYNH